MKSIVQSELHDAKLKLVQAINNQDKEMIKAYERVIKEVEQTLTDILDWHYRYWHGDAEKIIKFQEELSSCII